MFKFLREKIEKWTKNLAKKAEEKEKEERKEKVKTKPEKKIKKIKAKEIEVPKKFNAGTKAYEPDLEKLKEIQEELEEESKPGTKSFFQRITSKINKIKISE